MEMREIQQATDTILANLEAGKIGLRKAYSLMREYENEMLNTSKPRSVERKFARLIIKTLRLQIRRRWYTRKRSKLTR